MKDKKKIKISLSAIIIFLLIATIIGMSFYIYKLNKDKYYMTIGASQEIEELNNRINSLKVKIEQKGKEINELEDNDSNTNLDNIKENISNYDFIVNDQIVKINEDTKKFTSEDLKISFEFPKSWMISQKSNNNYEQINIESPMDSVMICMMSKENYHSESELKDILNIDFGSNVLEEGNIKISGYNAYFKEFTFGDGPDWSKEKIILIDLGNSEYYEIYFSVHSGEYYYDYSEKELLELYDEYEPIFDNIVSTLKFEK